MIQFHVLGRLELAVPGQHGSPLIAQPKRLAVLLYLAVATRRGFQRRDQIAAVFWPEMEQERARHALRQAVHVLRKELGEDVLLVRGDEEIGVNPDAFRSDVGTLLNALEEDRLEEAVGLYDGELLPGFHAPYAPAFERWLDDLRTELRARATDAARTLARRADAAGDASAAIGAAARALGISPADESCAELLMTLLAKNGDATGALRVYESFAHRLREEYELDPSPALQKLTAELRSVAARREIPLSIPANVNQVVRQIAAWPRSHRVAVTAAITLSVLFVGWVQSRRARAEAAVPPAIAVLPFTLSGDNVSPRLSDAIATMLASRFDGANGFRSVAPEIVLAAAHEKALDPERAGVIARNLRARVYLTGSVTGSGDRLLVRAVAHVRASAPRTVGSVAVEGSAQELPHLLDVVTTRVIAELETGPARRLRRLAALTTSSIPALKAFLSGEDAFHNGRFAAALRHYEAAARHDTAFALAFYRLAQASMSSADYAFSSLELAARALRLSTNLPEHDRLLIASFHAWRKGLAEAAEDSAQAAFATYPDHVEAWYLYGETLMHYNPSRGRALIEARPAFERVLALDPGHFGALWHLALLAAFEGKTRELDTLVHALLRAEPDDDQRFEIATLAAFARRDSAQETRMLAQLADASHARVFDVVWRTAIYARNLEGAMRVARLLTAELRPPYARRQGHIFLAHFEAAHGRMRAAQAELRAAAQIDPIEALNSSALLHLMPMVPKDPRWLRAVADSIAAFRTDTTESGTGRLHFIGRPKLAGLYDVALGRPDHALRRAATLENRARGPDSLLALQFAAAIRAHAYRAQGRNDQAIAALHAAHPAVWYGLAISDPLFSDADERFIHGEASLAEGDLRTALRWYDSLQEFAPHDLRYLPATLLRRAQIHRAWGDSARSGWYQRQFDALWRNADPELRRPTVAQDRPFALEHVNVVDVRAGRLLPDQTVVVEGNRVTAVGPASSVRTPAGATAIDARGKFLIPGLWDMHVHAAYPFIDAQFAPLFIANGVTGVREMFGTIMSLRAWKARVDTAAWPRIIGPGHILDGPRPIWPGSARAGNAEEGRRAVDSLRSAGADFIKVYNRIPRDAYLTIAAEAKRLGITFAGHVPDAMTVTEASDLGQRTVEHLTGVALECSTEGESLRAARVAANASADPAAALAALAQQTQRIAATQDSARCAALFTRLARNGTWVVPTLVVQRSMAWLDDSVFTADSRVRYIGRGIAAGWNPRTDFRLQARTPADWTNAKRAYGRNVNAVGTMHRAGVQLLAGTDVLNPYAFPGFSLHDELVLLVSAGLSPAAALRTATLNPAIFLNAADSLGTIERGKLADLVLLDANPLENISNTQKIRAVVANGRFLDRAALDALLANAERSARTP